MKNSRIVQQLKQLEPQLAGKLCFAPDLQYHARRQVFNRAVDAWPVAILEVQHIQDVCLAIRFAKAQHIQLSVKGGGHSTNGSCMLDDGLVLDMSALKQIQFDPIKRRVIVAAGVRNFELDKASSEHLQAVPLGTCPDVGVIGAAMGGGIGYLSCAYGLSCDSIESITLVNADAQILTVNSAQHSDLFWALCGGGGCQFGVVIDMTFRTYDVPKLVHGGVIEWPISECAEILKQYSDKVLRGAKDYFLYAYISHAAAFEAKISVMGFSLAGASHSQQLFTDIANWRPGASRELWAKSYLAIQSNAYEDGLSTYWKNGIIETGLSAACIEDIARCFKNCPQDGGAIMLDPLGGAIGDRALDHSAFVHRNARFICSFTGLSANNNLSAELRHWVDESHQVMQKHFNQHSYQNYEDLSIDEVSSYFGQHAQRLRQLKLHYDPENIFYGSLARARQYEASK